MAVQKQWEQPGRVLCGAREEIWNNLGYSLASPGECLKNTDIQPRDSGSVGLGGAGWWF